MTKSITAHWQDGEAFTILLLLDLPNMRCKVLDSGKRKYWNRINHLNGREKQGYFIKPECLGKERIYIDIEHLLKKSVQPS